MELKLYKISFKITIHSKEGNSKIYNYCETTSLCEKINHDLLFLHLLVCIFQCSVHMNVYTYVLNLLYYIRVMVQSVFPMLCLMDAYMISKCTYSVIYIFICLKIFMVIFLSFKCCPFFYNNKLIKMQTRQQKNVCYFYFQLTFQEESIYFKHQKTK